MKFYTTQHPYYCGIDLHARSLYVCIPDANGDTILHREIKALPEPLLDLLAPYIGNIVVGVECMHCWYWVSDFCAEHGIDFILGHALIYDKFLRKEFGQLQLARREKYRTYFSMRSTAATG